MFISKALIMRFEAPLFFANCRTLSKNLIHALEKRIHCSSKIAMNKTTRWKGCVIDLGSCGWIDVTACDVLKIPIQLYGKEGYPVYLARCNEMTKEMLIGSGVVELLHLYGGGLYDVIDDAVNKVLTSKKRKNKKNKKVLMVVK